MTAVRRTRAPRRSWLLVRGVRWRRGLSAAVLLVAAVTMGAAALGPVYARAAGESTLRDALQQAGSSTGLELRNVPFGDEQSSAVSSFDRAQAQAPQPGALRGYPTRIGSIDVQTDAAVPGTPSLKASLVWRTDACAHLVITGRCPTGPGQALISQRTVDGPYGWKMGSRITAGVGATLTVVGTYTPRDPGETYWFRHNYFDAAPGNDGRTTTPDRLDGIFVDRAEFDGLAGSAQGGLLWDYPLDPSAIRLDDVPGLRRDVAGLFARYRGVSPVTPGSGPPVDLLMTTRVTNVLDGAAHQRNLVDTGTLLVTLQLGLLAWLVLFEVVTDAVESRGNEIALAKLRGFTAARTVRFALGEVLALLVLAMPIGLLLAWGGARIFAASVLAPDTPVTLTWYTVAALAAGFAGGVAAAVAGSYRALTRTVLAQWRRTTHSLHASRFGLALDVVLSLAAIGGLILLRLRHHAGGNDNAALLAPGLLVVAVALLGTRLVPLLTRLLLRPTRASGSVGMFLAVRQVVRRPSGLRLAALLAVAVGLATFSVSGEAVAVANRTARARAEVGAQRVVAMQYARGTDPVAAVHTADPDGRWAAASASWLPDGGSVVGTVLAVDASRLAAVGFAAPGGPSSAQIAAAITGARPVPEVDISASALRMTISAQDIRGAPAQVDFLLRTPHQPAAAVSAGTLQAGTHTYTAAVPCAAGCTFLGILWDRDILFDGTMSGTVVVHTAEQQVAGAWRPLDLALSRPGGWRAGPEFGPSTDAPRATADGLRDDYHSTSGYGGVTYAYVPQPIPVVATPSAVLGGGQVLGPTQMTDIFGRTAEYAVSRSVAVLPVVGDNGVMVDITYLRTQLPGFDSEANWSIWLGPRAPADALQRLRDAGLTLLTSQTTQARLVQLGRQGPALSLILLLACAIVGSVVAVGGTAVAIRAGARRRSFETAALRAIGVRRASLYRGGVLEQVLLLGAAIVLGVPAGALAARLAMPVIPEFADATPILLRYQIRYLPVAEFAAGFAVLVCLTAAVAALAVVRAGRPTRLREVED